MTHVVVVFIHVEMTSHACILIYMPMTMMYYALLSMFYVLSFMHYVLLFMFALNVLHTVAIIVLL